MENTDKKSPNWLVFAEEGIIMSELYFIKAIEIIDKHFGEGYAKDHPELIGDFMNTASKNSPFIYNIKDYGVLYKDSDFG